MNRAYNINLNGKKIATAGGEKAGRFAATKKQTKRQTKPVRVTKRLLRQERPLIENIRLAKRMFSNGVKIVFLIAMLACAFRLGITESKPEPVEAQIPQITEVGDFESKEIPAQPETIEQKIIRIFGDHSSEALKVFKCESGFDPNVIGDLNTKYPSVGVAQIRLLPERNLNVADMLDADKNLEYAKNLFDKSGWKPWTCRKVL